MKIRLHIINGFSRQCLENWLVIIKNKIKLALLHKGAFQMVYK